MITSGTTKQIATSAVCAYCVTISKMNSGTHSKVILFTSFQQTHIHPHKNNKHETKILYKDLLSSSIMSYWLEQRELLMSPLLCSQEDVHWGWRVNSFFHSTMSGYEWPHRHSQVSTYMSVQRQRKPNQAHRINPVTRSFIHQMVSIVFLWSLNISLFCLQPW